MTLPLVSVIIPAYQIAPYIAETLGSVFAQTLTDFEVIVVNDGSPDTDELERELAPYRDRICYVRQENRGAGAARNRGVQDARETGRRRSAPPPRYQEAEAGAASESSLPCERRTGR